MIQSSRVNKTMRRRKQNSISAVWGVNPPIDLNDFGLPAKPFSGSELVWRVSPHLELAIPFSPSRSTGGRDRARVTELAAVGSRLVVKVVELTHHTFWQGLEGALLNYLSA